MYDINFFKKSYKLKEKITSRDLSFDNLKLIEDELEFLRNKKTVSP